MFVYEFLQKRIPWAKIYLWGHSLGTGITSKVSRILTEQDRPVVGLILESPFFNIVEEVELHPFTLVRLIFLELNENFLVSYFFSCFPLTQYCTR